MKYSVPTNWDEKLLDKIRKDDVAEIYGKLARDAIGGGRAAFILPQVSKKKVKEYVKKTHQYNLRFNYLLNSTCLGNMEWSAKGQQDIDKLLNWLQDINVDSVTVAVPYLLQLIKKRYPKFKVYISTQIGVSSMKEAKYWQDLGADRITLSVHKVNRDFKLLELLRENLKCEIQLIANLYCLKACPFWLYHGTCNAHNSQSDVLSRRFMIDYCFIMCSYIKLKDPAEFICSEWIRPEDVHCYEEIGIDKIKLVDRTMPTDIIVRIVEAYTNKKYNGNLLDLFSNPSKTLILQKPNLFQKFVYLFRPFSVNIFKLMIARKLISSPCIYIDNSLLDGFIKHFLENESCNLKSCEKCNYCREIAQKAVKIIDKNRYTNLINAHNTFLNQLISGDMFKYF